MDNDLSFIQKLKNFFFHSNYKKEQMELYNEILKQKQRFQELKKEYEESKNWNLEYSFLLKEATNSMNSFIWHKDKDHKYLLANPLHCESFFGLSKTIECLEYIKGKGDIELIEECYTTQGKLENTFGKICLLSDQYVEQRKKAYHFLEAGIIEDSEVLLYLIKIPQFDKENNFCGTIGIGWDLTNQSYDILKLLDRWKFDGLVTELFKDECVFCYAINPKVHKCQIFNHLCCKF